MILPLSSGQSAPLSRHALLRAAVVAAGAAALGAAIAEQPMLAFLALALAVVLMATRAVAFLSVALFWTLPYMAVNLPTGSFTLKLCDSTAYLFAAAWAARALLRRERIAFPPATLQVLVYLAVMAVSAALSPRVPYPYLLNLAAS